MSVEGDVSQLSKAFLDANALANVLRCEVTLEDAVLPFGRVTACGTLILCAALLHCALGAGRTGRPGSHELLLQSLEQAWYQSVGDGDFDIEASTKLGQSAKIDCEEYTHIERMWTVPILQGKSWVEGLLVAVADLESSDAGREIVRYRRIGYFLCCARVSLESDVYAQEIAAREPSQVLMDGSEYPLVDIIELV